MDKTDNTALRFGPTCQWVCSRYPMHQEALELNAQERLRGIHNAWKIAVS